MDKREEQVTAKEVSVRAVKDIDDGLDVDCLLFGSPAAGDADADANAEDSSNLRLRL